MKEPKLKKMINVESILKGKKRIFDVGTGQFGSDWWRNIDHDAKITGVEMYFFPKKVPKFANIYKLDAGDLGKVKGSFWAKKLSLFGSFIPEKVDWEGKYDLVVANHILEHVVDFPNTVKGISKLLKKDGMVYVGFPDHRNFTDIFYHLVHPNSGGHIQMLTDSIVEREFKKHGLKLISRKPWPDDWLWFEKLYNWKTYMWPENKYLTSDKISYLANVFRKELTTKKGYFYGWEMVFKKK